MFGFHALFDWLAHSVEDRLSWPRVIARDPGLYGQRSRYWSTADPIKFILILFAAWLCFATLGANYEPPVLSEREINYSAADFATQSTFGLFYMAIGAMILSARRSGRRGIILCLLTLPLAVSSTDAAQTPTTINQYNMLLSHIPNMSQWFQYFGGLLHRYGDHPHYQTAIEEAKQKCYFTCALPSQY